MTWNMLLFHLLLLWMLEMLEDLYRYENKLKLIVSKTYTPISKKVALCISHTASLVYCNLYTVLWLEILKYTIPE
jgi:hypothetical protein